MFFKKTNKILLLFVLLSGLTPFANANAGVPMLFIMFPGFLLSLIPIVLIETFYIKKRLADNSLKKIFNVVLGGNLLSTLVGIPLTWLAALLFQMLLGGTGAHGISTIWQKVYAAIVQAPWLIPYEDAFSWLIPVAFTVLMIYFFLASWLIEYGIIYLFLKKDYNKALIRKTVFKANLISYIFLYAAAVVYTLANKFFN